MLSALSADTARHVRRAGPVLEVIPTHCRQGCIQHLGPLLVGLGQSPHLVRGEAEVTEHCPERLAGIDRVEELLTLLGR